MKTILIVSLALVAFIYALKPVLEAKIPERHYDQVTVIEEILK